MSITPPENYTYGTVVGRFLSSIADSADADRYPDVIPATGKVVFTPNATYYKNTAWPATFINTPIEGTLDAAGFLVDNRGAPGVVLMATDHPDISPSGWTYKVTMTINGRQFTPFDIKVEGGQTIDLTTVMPASTSAGAITIVSEASRIAAEAAAAEAVAAVAEVPTIIAESLSEAAADAIESAVESADLVTKSQATALFAPRTVGVLKVFDIRDYLTPGQSLPNDGVADATALLRAANQAATDWRAAQGAAFRSGGIPCVIYAPSGAYRMTGQIPLRSGVGIIGDGRDRTVFYPEGEANFVSGATWSSEPVGGWTFFDDNYYADFTVECINQSSTSNNGAVKAFYTQNMRRLRFERVSVRNTWASSFGMDFLIDSQFSDCHVYGSGRGSTNTDTTGPTTSGFAPGTGRFPDESCQWTNCLAENCYGAGWLVEQVVGRGAFLQNPGFTLVNCRSVRNRFGLADNGSGGVSASGCDFSDNLHAGIAVVGSAGRAAGRLGQITGCTFARNGGGTGGPVSGGHGVVMRYGDPNGWTFSNNRFLNNAGHGIYLMADLESRTGGLRVSGGIMKGNGGSGVRIEALRYRLRGLEISGVQFEDNVGGGVYLDDGLTAPQIVDCTFIGSTQPVGIRWSPDRPTTNPVVRGNTFVNQAVAMSSTPTDNTLITGNVVTQTVNTATKSLAGSEPIYVLDGANTETRNATGLTWDSAQASTTYVVVDATPVGNTLYALIRDGSNQTKITVSRQTGNANWLAQVRNTTGGVTSVTVAGPVAKAVLCVVRTQTAVNLYVYGVGSNSAVVDGWPTVSTVTNVQRASGCVYATTFNGAHDQATRDAIMVRLNAEFVSV